MEFGFDNQHREPAETKPRSKIESKSGALEIVLPHGFGPMARVATAMGPVYAQTLREGDRVKTKSGEFLRIVSIKRILLDRDFLSRHPAAMPVLIRAGAFSRSIPQSDILLAPNQKINQNQALMGPKYKNALEAMRKPGVTRRTEEMITYTTFHCGRPATVSCEGLWVETAP